MKRAILSIIVIALFSFPYQLLASSEGIVARLGFGPVFDVKFSPDGKILAISVEYGVYLYNPFTLAQIAYLPGHTDWMSSVAFSPDGSLIAGGSDDSTKILWDGI